MPRLRLTQKGFTTFTGKLHNIQFTDGVTDDIPTVLIDRIVVGITGNIVAADGTTIVSPAGATTRLAAVPYGKTAPADPAEPAGVASK